MVILTLKVVNLTFKVVILVLKMVNLTINMVILTFKMVILTLKVVNLTSKVVPRDVTQISKKEILFLRKLKNLKKLLHKIFKKKISDADH